MSSTPNHRAKRLVWRLLCVAVPCGAVLYSLAAGVGPLAPKAGGPYPWSQPDAAPGANSRAGGPDTGPGGGRGGAHYFGPGSGRVFNPHRPGAHDGLEGPGRSGLDGWSDPDGTHGNAPGGVGDPGGPGRAGGSGDDDERSPGSKKPEPRTVNPPSRGTDQPTKNGPGVTTTVQETGEVKLNAQPVNGGAGPHSPGKGAGPLTMSNMAPGAYSVGAFELENTGKKTLEYVVRGVYTGKLAPVLVTTVKVGVSSCTTAGFSRSGSFITVAPDTKKGGDPHVLTGPRNLAPGKAERVCVRVLMSPSAGNEYQAQTAKLNLMFQAGKAK